MDTIQPDMNTIDAVAFNSDSGRIIVEVDDETVEAIENFIENLTSDAHESDK